MDYYNIHVLDPVIPLLGIRTKEIIIEKMLMKIFIVTLPKIVKRLKTNSSLKIGEIVISTVQTTCFFFFFSGTW